MLWLIFAMSLGEVVMMFFGVTIFVGPPSYRFRAVPLPEALLAAVGSKVSQKIVKSSISVPKRDSGNGNDPWRITAWRDGLSLPIIRTVGDAVWPLLRHRSVKVLVYGSDATLVIRCGRRRRE